MAQNYTVAIAHLADVAAAEELEGLLHANGISTHRRHNYYGTEYNIYVAPKDRDQARQIVDTSVSL
jgi:hypothetical protein